MFNAVYQFTEFDILHSDVNHSAVKCPLRFILGLPYFNFPERLQLKNHPARILVPRRQLTLVNSESEIKWKHGVRSKYIVRPAAVEEVLSALFLLRSDLFNKVWFDSYSNPIF